MPNCVWGMTFARAGWGGSGNLTGPAAYIRLNKSYSMDDCVVFLLSPTSARSSRPPFWVVSASATSPLVSGWRCGGFRETHQGREGFLSKLGLIYGGLVQFPASARFRLLPLWVAPPSANCLRPYVWIVLWGGGILSHPTGPGAFRTKLGLN